MKIRDIEVEFDFLDADDVERFEKEAKNDNSEALELVNTNSTPQTELEDKKENKILIYF